MKEYLLLFRQSLEAEEAWAVMTPEEVQAVMARWGAWVGSLAAQGKLVGGNPLPLGGKVIRGTAKVVTDGPYVEAKEVIGGYLLIKADGLDDAVRISEDCPGLLSEAGSVEVREVTQMTM